MTKRILIFAFLFFLSACTFASQPTPTKSPTLKPEPTITPEPSLTPTTLPLLTINDVGLPIKDLTFFEYRPCYVFTEDRFHAGDGIYLHKDDAPFIVYSPISGVIQDEYFIDDFIGWEINIKSDFLLDSQWVYVDIVHIGLLYGSLEIGSQIKKGEPLAVIDSPHGDPGGRYLIDIAIRKGSHKQANPNFDDWTGTEYLSFKDFIEDDLASLDQSTFTTIGEPCLGNPIPEEKRK